MSKSLLKEVRDNGVAVLTLNRPERLNAWTQELERAYFAALAECGAPEDVRVIVVTGAGRGFCAGADMNELQSLGEGGVDAARPSRSTHGADVSADRAEADHRGDQRPVRRNRPRAGADVRHPLRRRGREDHDGLRAPRARRGARHLVDPAAARRAGAGTRPAAVRARRARAGGCRDGAREPRGSRRECSRRRSPTRELATQCSPASMATIKRQVYAALEQALPVALAEADQAMLRSFGRPDFVEGVSSFVERRAPRFAPVVE